MSAKLPFKLAVIIGLFSFSMPATAQWQKLNGPHYPGLNELLRSADTVLTTVVGEVYRSNDQGKNWQKVFEGNSLMRNPTDQGVYVLSNSNGLDVYGSHDFGQHWAYQFTMPIAGQLVPGFNQDTIFIMEPFDIARKTINGWDTIFQIPQFSGTLNKVARTGNHLWVASSLGAYHSPDLGETWTQLNFSNSTLAVKGDTVLLGYCTADAYLARTTDFGLTWEFDTLSAPKICNLEATEDEFYSINSAFDNYNIYTSHNGLTDWDTLYLDTLLFYPHGFRKFGNELLLASYKGLPHLNNGHWTFKQFPPSIAFPDNNDYRVLHYLDSTLFASNYVGGHSIDNGETWNSSAFITMPNVVQKMNHGYAAIQHIDDKNLYICPDNGYFEWIKRPLPFNPQSIATIGDTIYIAESSTDLRSLYRTTDGGLGWTAVSSSLVGSLFALNGQLIMFGPDNLRSSSDGGVNWTEILNFGFSVDTTPLSLTVEKGDIYVTNYFSPWVIRSSNGGATFDTISIPNHPVSIFGIHFRAIGDWNFLSYVNDTVFVKRRDSDNWIQLPLPQPSSEWAGGEVKYFAASDSLFFLPDQHGNIWRLNAAQLGEIKGVVFKDDNQNELQDPDEKGAPNVMVQGQLTGFFGVTDSLGNYHVTINRESDLIRPVTSFPYYFYSPVEANAHLLGNTTLNFALQTNDTVTDLSLNLSAATAFRPGFNNTLYVSVANVGTSAAAGEVRLVLDPLLTVEATAPPTALISGDTVIWPLTSLASLTNPRTFQVDVKTGFALPGTIIPLKASVATLLDAHPLNNQDTLIEHLVAAFDPNDKLVRPDKILIDQLTDTELRYTIRFQNTGNIPTDFVVLRDTLSSLLEVSSIQILGASHPFSWSLEKGNILLFEFKPLHLQPEALNELASHGFVSFSIKLKPGALLGQEIVNMAYIYFDYNPAIVTNAAKTTITAFSPSSSLPALTTLAIHPNPASQWIHLEAPETKDQAGVVSIFHSNGKLVMQRNTDRTTLDIKLSDFSEGSYLVFWRLGNKAYSGTFTVFHP